MLRTWVRYVLKYYLCNGNFISVISPWIGRTSGVRATPLYCHTVSPCSLKAELCCLSYLLRRRVQGSTLTLPQLCLWLFSQTLHLPWACQDSASSDPSPSLQELKGSWKPLHDSYAELDSCSYVLASWEVIFGRLKKEWSEYGSGGKTRGDKMVTWSAFSEENRRI